MGSATPGQVVLGINKQTEGDSILLDGLCFRSYI